MYAMDTVNKLLPGIYQHYKGQSYLVFVTASHTETDEAMVVYTSSSNDKILWTRPASMFSETVDSNGEQVPRFRFIRPLHHSEKLLIY